MGDISLWEVSSREKLVSRNFQVWDIGASSMMLKVCSLITRDIREQIHILFHWDHLNLISNETQATLIKDPCVSVKRILWSPDGSLFGKFEYIGRQLFSGNRFNIIVLSNRSCIF